MKKLLLVVSAAVFMLCIIMARPARAVEKKQYNVILIVVDALRADHLGCYGYDRKTSPSIDALSKEGTLFLNTSSQATWTLPSFSSILTSRYVFQHGVVNDGFKLSDSELTLAEALKIFKYQTAAFTTSMHLNKQFNLIQGFDLYEDVSFSQGTWPNPTEHISETVPRVMKWLDEHADKKFFLLFHANDVHSPLNSWQPAQNENMFDPDYKGVVDHLVLDQPLREQLWGYLLGNDSDGFSALKEKDIAHIKAHYDASIFYTDIYIGKLLKYLKKKGLMENTIVILTADHGIDLFDHGTFLANSVIPPYEEVVHVPLIIVHPDKAMKGHRIPDLMESVDILPTILDCLGIPPKQDAQGLSLVPFLEGESHQPDRFIYSESSDPRESSGRAQLKYSVRQGSWKLIGFLFRGDIPFFALYNISQDPGECRNLFNDNAYSEIRDKLLAELRRCYQPKER